MNQMVFDRTLSDVRNAADIRKTKVQKGEALTEADISALERGTLSLNTLNRVELKQAELAEILTGMGYYITIQNREWNENDIFTESDFARIVDNNAKLRESFYVYADSPMDAVAAYHFEELNALERILYDLERMIEYTKSHYRICGIYNCGEG